MRVSCFSKNTTEACLRHSRHAERIGVVLSVTRQARTAPDTIAVYSLRYSGCVPVQNDGRYVNKLEGKRIETGPPDVCYMGSVSSW